MSQGLKGTAEDAVAEELLPLLAVDNPQEEINDGFHAENFGMASIDLHQTYTQLLESDELVIY